MKNSVRVGQSDDYPLSRSIHKKGERIQVADHDFVRPSGRTITSVDYEKY